MNDRGEKAMASARLQLSFGNLAQPVMQPIGLDGPEGESASEQAFRFQRVSLDFDVASNGEAPFHPG